MRAGFAEVVKYGLLGDAQFFHWLEEHSPALFRHEPDALGHAIERCVEMKARIVERDETETGERALLNLGHTFGHALEAWAGYSSRLLHGEAVAIGMRLAFRLSEELGLCPPQTAARVSAHLKAAGLPTLISNIPGGETPSRETLLRLMHQDKKVRDGRLTLILVKGIGQAFITRDVAASEVSEFLGRELI
jgi:3-dehydroquinate synthetase